MSPEHLSDFLDEQDERALLDPSDPKSPGYAEWRLDAIDMARKRRREDPAEVTDFDVDESLTKRDADYYAELPAKGVDLDAA